MRTPSLVLIAALSFAGAAGADEGRPSFSQTPVTEAFLRQLDSEQHRLLHDAIQGCGTVGMLRDDENDPCVVMRTDDAVAKSGNPDLQTFHRALQPRYRYNETRSATVWQVWLMKD